MFHTLHVFPCKFHSIFLENLHETRMESHWSKCVNLYCSSFQHFVNFMDKILLFVLGCVHSAYKVFKFQNLQSSFLKVNQTSKTKTSILMITFIIRSPNYGDHVTYISGSQALLVRCHNQYKISYLVPYIAMLHIIYLPCTIRMEDGGRGDNKFCRNGWPKAINCHIVT